MKSLPLRQFFGATQTSGQEPAPKPKEKRPGVFSEHVRGETAADVDGSTERRDVAARPEDRIAAFTLGSRVEEWRGAKHSHLDRDD